MEKIIAAGWEGKADDWFDNILSACRENLAATDNRATTFASDTRREALGAYENALSRSSNSANTKAS